MTGKECAENWKKIVAIYMEDIKNENARPDHTMDKILAVMDADSVCSAFAAVAAAKPHDGRISPANRKFLEEAFLPDECENWDRKNPMVYAGIDDMHMAHVDNLVSQLRAKWESVVLSCISAV